MANATTFNFKKTIKKKKQKQDQRRKKKFSRVNITRPEMGQQNINSICKSYRGLFTSQINQNSQFCKLLGNGNSCIRVQPVAV